MPALHLDAAICPPQPGRRAGQRQFLGPDLYFDDLMLQAADRRRFISVEKVVDTDDLAGQGTLHPLRISRMMVDGVVEAPERRPLHRRASPTTSATRRSRSAYAAAARSPEAWAAFRPSGSTSREDEYQRKVRGGGER